MWFANFFIASSMTMILPFIALYIETLGNFTDAYVQTWSGLVFAITFVTAFIVAPIWGRIGDKYGRKNILIISSSGLALSVLLMGFATTVWQLFLLRLFMGLFTGFIPMSQALISTQTPKKTAGKILGTLQTAGVSGSLLGPLIGGVLADSIGYSATFQLVSISIFISAIIVKFGIKEMQLKITSHADGKMYSTKEVLQHIISHPVLLVVMLTSTLVQVAHFSIQPIISLYVIEINGPEQISFYAGLTFSAAGLGSLLFVKPWGKFGDRFGHANMLVILLILAAIAYFPGAFVTNIWQLVGLRFVVGSAIGGILLSRIAYIRNEAPLSMQGEVIGYNTSLQFLGNIIGPSLGGILSALFGFSSIFFVTSSLLIGTSLLLTIVIFKREQANKRLVTNKT